MTLGTFAPSPRRTILASLALIVPVLLAGCDGKPKAPAAPPPVVGVLTLHAEPVMRTTELPGRVNATLMADVRPQVNGVLLKRLFTEGSEVKEGQQLYQIDPAPYQATYDSAVAALARDQATYASASAKAARYKPLAAAQAISNQDYDDAVAAAREAQASIGIDKASIETARINLQYTKVLAPISGHIGRSSVTAGALVTASQTDALATVTQLDPIYVDVRQSAASLLRLRRALAAGDLENTGSDAAKVTLTLEDGSAYPLAGELKFTEVTVDAGTGTVLLRAAFPNPRHELLPGMFVHAELREGVNRNGLLVPQEALTHNSHGDATVLVVGADNKAELRIVQAIAAIGTKWLIGAGLKEGERVIVDGLQSVRPGMVVKPADAAAPAAASPKKS